MPADYSRIHRLLKILTLIQAEDDWTAERLAAECHVNIRTIYRDMKMLEGAGIPYFHDLETKGYRVRRDFFMPPVSLTLDESLALIALGEHIGGKEQIPLTKAAEKAISKVRSQLPHSIRDEVAKLDGHIKIQLAAADREVVTLFALFHDSRRINEHRDDGHGLRGAELARSLRGSLVHLDDDRFELLFESCRLHTDGHTAGDPTLQVCWDADRLDLGRVGITPRPERLCTQTAREVRKWAHERAVKGIEPRQVLESWGVGQLASNT